MLSDKERKQRDKWERTPPKGRFEGNPLYGQVLSERQEQALIGLIDNPRGKTYKQAAKDLGISEGTLHGYLSLARRKQPERYQEVMAIRKKQLAFRHERSLEKTKRRKHEWYMQNRYTVVERVYRFIEDLRKVKLQQKLQR